MTRRMIAPLIFGLACVAILITLGVWQLQRLEWKRTVLAGIEARIAAPAVDIPAAPTEAADEYLHVAVAGTIEPGEIHIYTSAPPRGVGYRIIAPFRLPDGRRVLVDRGFVPIADKEAPRPPGRLRVEGALLWPNETDGWTPAPDLVKNIWLARDVPAMAVALGTEPVMIVASATDDPAGPTPMPVGVNISNNHLQYAITWFLLAAAWAMMTGYLLWRIKRRTI